MPTYFDLSIRAAFEFQSAILAPTHQIARAVDPAVSIVRVRTERLGGEFWFADVATGQTVTTGVEFAHYPDRHAAALRVEHQHIRVGYWLTDGNRAAGQVRCLDLMTTGEGGVFGRPVAVDQAGLRQRRECPPHVR